jgi:hypothetical protein
MIFPRHALASGPGTAWNSIAFTPSGRKVKVGKRLYDIDLNGKVFYS